MTQVITPIVIKRTDVSGRVPETLLPGELAINYHSGDFSLYARDESGNILPLAGKTYAPLNSPTFTGNPCAPTPTITSNSTTIATTNFVNTAVTNATGSSVSENNYSQITLNTTSASVINIYDTESFSSGETRIQITRGSNLYTSKLVWACNGTNWTFTEYGVLILGSNPISNISCNLDGMNLQVIVTPSSSESTTCKIAAQLFLS